MDANSGPGKSVLCSKIITYIQEKTEMGVLFYFCHHFPASNEISSEVLKDFATQLLTADPGLAPYILDTFANNGEKPTKKILAEVLENLIASSKPIRLVVDGLNELSGFDQEDLIIHLLRIGETSPAECKILFSSREWVSLANLLYHRSSTFRLRDCPENINCDVAAFVHRQLKRLRQTCEPGLIDELEGSILRRADGMSISSNYAICSLD